MSVTAYIVKDETSLAQILAKFGYWDFEITSAFQDKIWGDPSNQKKLAGRDKYVVQEGDYLFIPKRPVVQAPAAPAGAGSLKVPPSPLTLWAGIEAGPLECKDDDVRLSIDTPYGQSNWMVATRFSTFSDLADKLTGSLKLPSWAADKAGPEIQDNQIKRLGICAHGNDSMIQIDGSDFVFPNDKTIAYRDPAMLSVLTYSKFQPTFKRILPKLAPNAVVLFYCCLSGNDAEGTTAIDLFKAISNEWKSKWVKVVAFRSILYSSSGQQKNDGTHYVGARQTHYATHRQPTDAAKFRRVYDLEKYWNDLSKFPWADEGTSHALVARGGDILQRGLEPNPWGLGPEIDADDLSVK